MAKNEFIAAVLGPPFGVAGFIKFRSLSGETAHITALSSLRLRKDGAESVRAVEEWRKGRDGGGVVKLAGIDTPEAARLLSGAEVVVSRDAAAPLGKGEYYLEDLKGLTVVSGGAERGFVRALVLGAQRPLLEIELFPDGAMCLVPFQAEFIGGVSLLDNKIEIVSWALDK